MEKETETVYDVVWAMHQRHNPELSEYADRVGRAFKRYTRYVTAQAVQTSLSMITTSQQLRRLMDEIKQ